MYIHLIIDDTVLNGPIRYNDWRDFESFCAETYEDIHFWYYPEIVHNRVISDLWQAITMSNLIEAAIENDRRLVILTASFVMFNELALAVKFGRIDRYDCHVTHIESGDKVATIEFNCDGVPSQWGLFQTLEKQLEKLGN